MLTGVYAELRSALNRRFLLVEELIRAKNRLQKWVVVYFPEYKGIYTHIDDKESVMRHQRCLEISSDQEHSEKLHSSKKETTIIITGSVYRKVL